jgi:cytoskeletal protein RodZ
MKRAHSLSVITVALVVAAPLAWLACGGGETKPPETAAGESSASASSEAPAASDSAAPAESASAAAADTSSASPSSDSTAAAPPPSPSFGSTDCGKCIDKACAKPEVACGKNTDCQAILDGIHSCSSGAAACLDSATPASAAKPKKLASAVETCAKKAITAKACKAKCQ